MYSPKLALLVVATAIGGALAQFDTATPSGTGYLVDNCIYGCISQAASSAGCSGLYVKAPEPRSCSQTAEARIYRSDLPCICSSSKFESTSSSCLQKSCTKADAQWGQTWYKDSCAYGMMPFPSVV